MSELLFDLLVNKNNTSEDEIVRLSKFRGLDTVPNETDIKIFLIKYFSKDSIANYSICTLGHYEKWAKSFAGNPLWGIRVNPLKLEPFVARYVNAINMIGAKTISSCDGWHEETNNELFIIFKDRYSRIWHKILFNRLSEKYGIEWSYNGNKMFLSLPKNDEEKIKRYIALNECAEAFEKSGNELLQLKRAMVDKLKGKTKNNLSDDEVEKMFIRTINDTK